jgi:hypothetical protein
METDRRASFRQEPQPPKIWEILPLALDSRRAADNTIHPTRQFLMDRL